MTEQTEGIRRAANGRPYIKDPVTGKETSYTRTSTFAKALSDGDALSSWKLSMMVKGLMVDPGLLNMVLKPLAELEGDIDHPDLKDKIKSVVALSMEAGGANVASSWGTLLHEFADIIDFEDTPLTRDMWELDESLWAALDAYVELTKEMRMISGEQFVVQDELKVAGSYDRTAEWRGRIVCTDLKGLALSTALPTPTGWTTMGEVQVGDWLIDMDGQPCQVTAISTEKPVESYRLTFGGGQKILADVDHRWLSRRGSKSPWAVRTTGKIASTETVRQVPCAKPLQLPEADLPIEPWLFGYWLGNGATRGGVLHCKDSDEPHVRAMVTGAGYLCGPVVKESSDHGVSFRVHGLTTALRALGVANNKHIPDTYFRASIRQRTALLRGLMDSDGTWNKARRRAVFAVVDETLAVSLHELIVSLGEKAKLQSWTGHGFGKDVRVFGVEWNPLINPFSMPRKSELVDDSRQVDNRSFHRIVSIEPVGIVRTKCVTVDSPTSTYLCGGHMIVTHNTGAVRMPDHAAQLALYSRSKGYNKETGERIEGPIDTVDQSVGLIVHLPRPGVKDSSGRQIEPSIIPVDIEAGWKCALLANEVREARKGKYAFPMDEESK